VKLRLGLHVTRSPQGQYAATLDSLDQGAMGLPIAVTRFSDNLLHLESPNLRVSFDGELSKDGNEIFGAFTQGATLPLTLKRVARASGLNRPQHPRAPFGYASEEVVVENRTAGVKLAGTLTRPRTIAPAPAAVLISGSGPQDRDSTLFAHKPFLVIADALTRQGMAVLRMDDRGVGGSSGNLQKSTLDDLAGDALAAVAFLKSRKDIDGAHIGLIGHSEGAVVAPLAASRSKDVAFVVMLAGTGVPGEEVLYRQGELIARSTGADETAISEARELQRRSFAILRAEPQEAAAAARIQAAWAADRDLLPPAARTMIDSQIGALTTAEVRSFLFHDPAEVLRKLKQPVLALGGERDVQVPSDQNLPAIRAAFEAGGNPDFSVRELPGLNHLFQKCNTCTVLEYGGLEETFSPEALGIVVEWVTGHAGVSRRSDTK
jgi:pimeloyl-ACP methyl ester carboxylesterase